MKRLSTFSSAAVLSVLVAGSVLSPAYACHPQGHITKSVQNLTAGGEAKPADSAANALSAKPGDILQYTIEVANTAAPAGNHYNDLAYTVLTDNLPAGVVLVGDPSVRTITHEIGTILPSESNTQQYKVRVSASKNGELIVNKACFTANSVVKDNPQTGCDGADVMIDTPTVTPTPAPTPTPTPSPTPKPTPVPVPTTSTPTATSPTPTAVTVTETQPSVLPNTGVGTTVALMGGASSIAGYLAYAFYIKRRSVA